MRKPRTAEQKAREAARQKAYYNADPERRIKAAEYARNRRRQIRTYVLMWYGGKCNCCGENGNEFLTIDHINGGGRAHRKSIYGRDTDGGHAMYLWIFRNGFPEGFQVLCANCNTAKAKGVCPHQDPLYPISSN